jgi:hypothetical protein
MYDPTVGRFITEDPIGFDGGDVNLGRYCGNSPVNCTDPNGLWPIVPLTPNLIPIVPIDATPPDIPSSVPPGYQTVLDDGTFATIEKFIGLLKACGAGDIVVYIGHCNADGSIASSVGKLKFVGPKGGYIRVGPEAITAPLKGSDTLAGTLVLGACNSENMAREIAKNSGIKNVIGFSLVPGGHSNNRVDQMIQKFFEGVKMGMSVAAAVTYANQNAPTMTALDQPIKMILYHGAVIIQHKK